MQGYIIVFSEDHPFDYMAGLVTPLFPVEGGWGYNHPKEEDRVIKVRPAGTNLDSPNLGQIHPMYEIMPATVVTYSEGGNRTLRDLVHDLGFDDGDLEEEE